MQAPSHEERENSWARWIISFSVWTSNWKIWEATAPHLWRQRWAYISANADYKQYILIHKNELFQQKMCLCVSTSSSFNFILIFFNPFSNLYCCFDKSKWTWSWIVINTSTSTVLTIKSRQGSHHIKYTAGTFATFSCLCVEPFKTNSIRNVLLWTRFIANVTVLFYASTALNLDSFRRCHQHHGELWWRWER